MSDDDQEPEGSPRLFIRRLTLPTTTTTANRTTRLRTNPDFFSSDDDNDDDSDAEPRAPRSSRKTTRGYYGTDSGLSSSSEDDDSSGESSDDYSSPGRKRYRSRNRRSRRRRRASPRAKNNGFSSRLEANSVYPFSLPGHHHHRGAQTLFSENGSTKGSDDTDSEKGDSESSSVWRSTVKDVQHVYGARYTGEKLMYGGLQSVELKTSQYDGKSGQTPLFQWMYVSHLTKWSHVSDML